MDDSKGGKMKIVSIHFDGETYDPELDRKRLTGQLLRVYTLMSDGAWRTLAQIAKEAQGSESSVSARLRDLRKARFGQYRIDKRRVTGGLWEYKMITEGFEFPSPIKQENESE